MLEPLSNQPLPQPQAAPTYPNVALLATTMQDQVTELANQLQQGAGDPSLSTSPPFLKQFATNGLRLHQTVQDSLLIR